LNDISHRLGLDGVEAEDESAEEGGGGSRRVFSGRPGGYEHQQIDEKRVRQMDEEVGEVIADRIQPAGGVVDGAYQVGQRPVGAGEHPLEVADLLVINKADLPGTNALYRDLQMLAHENHPKADES